MQCFIVKTNIKSAILKIQRISTHITINCNRPNSNRQGDFATGVLNGFGDASESGITVLKGGGLLCIFRAPYLVLAFVQNTPQR